MDGSSGKTVVGPKGRPVAHNNYNYYLVPITVEYVYKIRIAI